MTRREFFGLCERTLLSTPSATLSIQVVAQGNYQVRLYVNNLIGEVLEITSSLQAHVSATRYRDWLREFERQRTRVVPAPRVTPVGDPLTAAIAVAAAARQGMYAVSPISWRGISDGEWLGAPAGGRSTLNEIRLRAVAQPSSAGTSWCGYLSLPASLGGSNVSVGAWPTLAECISTLTPLYFAMVQACLQQRPNHVAVSRVTTRHRDIDLVDPKEEV